MKRSELEKYLGKYVEVTLYDDCAYRGVLCKTESKLERYGNPKHYYCEGIDDNTIYRCSHVKKVREL